MGQGISLHRRKGCTSVQAYKELSVLLVLGYLAKFSELTECASRSPSCLGIDASTSLFSDDISQYGI